VSNLKVSLLESLAVIRRNDSKSIGFCKDCTIIGRGNGEKAYIQQCISLYEEI
jgi:hypothetical protein